MQGRSELAKLPLLSPAVCKKNIIFSVYHSFSISFLLLLNPNPKEYFPTLKQPTYTLFSLFLTLLPPTLSPSLPALSISPSLLDFSLLCSLFLSQFFSLALSPPHPCSHLSSNRCHHRYPLANHPVAIHFPPSSSFGEYA